MDLHSSLEPSLIQEKHGKTLELKVEPSKTFLRAGTCGVLPTRGIVTCAPLAASLKLGAAPVSLVVAEPAPNLRCVFATPRLHRFHPIGDPKLQEWFVNHFHSWEGLPYLWDTL